VSAKAKIQNALDSGEALERFRRNVELQGGDAIICDKPEVLLRKGLAEVEVKAPASGYVAAIDTFAVGRAICDLGGGRVKAEDGVDHAVGYAHLKKLGQKVRRGDVLGVVYCRRPSQADLVSETLRNAYKIGEERPRTTKLVRATV
jgi:thymidine phosphorylase